MPIPGVRTKICEGPDCREEFVFLPNREKGTFVPVNVESLSEDDIATLEMTHRPGDVDYESGRHISHYRTCKRPERFAGKGKK